MNEKKANKPFLFIPHPSALIPSLTLGACAGYRVVPWITRLQTLKQTPSQSFPLATLRRAYPANRFLRLPGGL
jgi:hypothetical protein